MLGCGLVCFLVGSYLGCCFLEHQREIGRFQALLKEQRKSTILLWDFSLPNYHLPAAEGGLQGALVQPGLSGEEPAIL